MGRGRRRIGPDYGVGESGQSGYLYTLSRSGKTNGLRRPVDRIRIPVTVRDEPSIRTGVLGPLELERVPLVRLMLI